MIRTSSCSAGLYNYITAGRVRATPDTRRLEDELCDTKTIHRHWKSSNKNSSSMFSMCECLFYVCLRSHSRICVLFLYKLMKFEWVCLCVSLSSSLGLCGVWLCVCTCVLECVPVIMSLYTNYSPLQNLSPTLDVGALGVIGGGGCWRVASSLFGVIETIVVLIGAWWRLRGATGEKAPTQQGEDGAHPSSVEGEAEWHEALLLVGADGKPDRRHHTTQCWGKTERLKFWI